MRLLLSFVVMPLLWAGRAAPAGSQPVTIKLFQFEPTVLEVAVDTRVVWTNTDDIEHTIASGTGEQSDGRFSGVVAGKGQSFGFVFTEPGVYSYYCDRHRFMHGEVRVTSTGKAGN